MEYFVVGQVVRITHSVYNDAGVLTNAGSVTLTITLPDGTTLIPGSVTNTGTGLYRYDYTTTQAGRHTYRWDTTAPIAPDDGSFDVHATTVGIISLEDAKAQQNIDSNASDEELRPFIEATTRVIEDHTGKVIVRRTITEDHSVSYTNELWLRHRPVLSLTSVTSWDLGTTWTVGNLRLNADWGRLTVHSGPWLVGDLVVTLVAGMSVIPANYTMAARIIVQHLWQTQQQPGIGPPNPFDTESGQSFVPSGFAIPHRALELLGPSPPMVA